MTVEPPFWRSNRNFGGRPPKRRSNLQNGGLTCRAARMTVYTMAALASERLEVAKSLQRARKEIPSSGEVRFSACSIEHHGSHVWLTPTASKPEH
eukprot:2323061-Pyramimonas_sp.AAC.1